MTDFQIDYAEAYNRNIMKLHILYLEKIDRLNSEERKVFSSYLKDLSEPVMAIHDISIAEMQV